MIEGGGGEETMLLILFLTVSLSSRELDIYQLLLLKKKVTKDPQGFLRSWSPDSRQPPCDWNGITCNEDLRVRSVELGGRGLSFPIQNDFAPLRMLQVLNLSGNQIWGPIPVRFEGHPYLRIIDFSNNKISGSISSQTFNNLPELQYFILSRNSISGGFPGDICTNAAKIRVFHLDNNNLSGTGTLGNITGCKDDLEELHIQNNKLSISLEAGWQFFRRLRSLNIANNRLQGRIPEELGKCKLLVNLRLQNNELTGEVPASLGLLEHLVALDLSFNKLYGRLPAALGRLGLLESLKISNNALMGPIPDTLSDLQALREVLDLSNNKLSGSLNLFFLNLRFLKRIDISGNKLSGELPAGLGDCDALVVLYFQGNRFSGSVPPDFMKMTSLEIMDLSRNALDGVIPPELGKMKSIRYMNFSRNALNGGVPESLAFLLTVKRVDLTNNQFEGPVPDLPFFRNAAVVSLRDGNNRLCGWINNKACEVKPSNRSSEQEEKKKEPMLVAIKQAALTVGVLLALSFFMIVFLMQCCRLFSPELYEYYVDCLETRCFCCIGMLSLFRLTSLRPRVTLDAVVAATNDFHEENVIGAGGRFTVYKAVFLQSVWLLEGTYALKRLNEAHWQRINEFQRECRILARICHPNVLNVVDWRSTADELFVVTPLVAGGSLERQLQSRFLDWGARYTVALNVAQGLNYLHEMWWERRRIVRCNLHLGNILLDDPSLHARLSGLRCVKEANLAKLAFDDSEQPFVAPECNDGGMLSKEGEVYSYGIFLFKLIVRKEPSRLELSGLVSFSAWIRSMLAIKREGLFDPALVNTAPTYGHLLGLIDVGLSCTKDNPDQRPSMKDVIATLGKLQGATYTCNLLQRPSFFMQNSTPPSLLQLKKEASEEVDMPSSSSFLNEGPFRIRVPPITSSTPFQSPSLLACPSNMLSQPRPRPTHPEQLRPMLTCLGQPRLPPPPLFPRPNNMLSQPRPRPTHPGQPRMSPLHTHAGPWGVSNMLGLASLPPPPQPHR